MKDGTSSMMPRLMKSQKTMLSDKDQADNSSSLSLIEAATMTTQALYPHYLWSIPRIQPTPTC